MQGFGTWFKNSFVALILTSVIFGLLHGVNPEVEKLGSELHQKSLSYHLLKFC